MCQLTLACYNDSMLVCRPYSCCHTFRATGITAYLENGGLLEHAQQMAGHASARTTKLYDRRGEQISLDEVERIAL